MSRQVKLSKKASKKLSQLLVYLGQEWSEKAKKDFLNKLDKSLAIICKNPESFEKSDLIKGLHRCVITKQTTIFYKYNARTVFIVTLFDNRQDPNKLKKEIK